MFINNFSFRGSLMKGVYRAIVILAGLSCGSFAQGQTLTFPLNNGFNATVNGAGPTICQPSSAASAGNMAYRFAPIIPATLNNSNIGINLYSNDEAGYHIAQAGVARQIIIDIPNAGGLGLNGTLFYNYGQFDGAATTQLTSSGQFLPPAGGSPFGTIRHIIDLNFPLGIRKGYLAFRVVDGDLTSPWPPHMCVIPFVVEGPTVSQVDSLGITVQPQMPYLVLHAPPGDGSSSEFQKSQTTCRELVDTYTESSSNSANLAVKLGTKGSIGFIATIDFEFSVTFSGGVTAGDMVVTTKKNQTCVTVNEKFSTTELTGPNGGGDVFIGYGTDLAYGVYPYILADPAICGSRLDTGLVFRPVGEPRKFAYTKTAILSDIALLQSVVNDSLTVGARTANYAQNQIDVWNQVLMMNDSNVNNPNNEVLGTLNFSAGVNSSQESNITVTETNSINYEHYLEGTFGVQSVVNVGGSGVSGGYEFKSARKYGATENQSSSTSKLVKYTLADGDPGDIFNLEVVRDPMFGTPAFRILPGTKSSCPYQGGYQRDLPSMVFTGQQGDSIDLLGIPVGTSASFQLELCNDSDEAREYTLKLNPQSNLNGAVVTAAGLPLNNAFGQSFTVPANSCLPNPLIIEVKRQSDNSPLAYPDLELFLEPSCDETAGIRASLYVSVLFSNNTSLKDADLSAGALRLAPNPATDQVSLTFDLTTHQFARIMVFDLQGRLLHVSQTQLPEGLSQYVLQVADLPNGIYTVRVEGEALMLTRKMVVQD